MIFKNVSLNIVKGYHSFDMIYVKVVAIIIPDNLLYSYHETFTFFKIFSTKPEKTHLL